MALAHSEPAPACPSCGDDLVRDAERYRCPSCAGTVPVVEGVAQFPVDADPDVFDALSPIYETPLWFRPLYRLVGGPSAPADDRRAIARLLDPGGDEALLDVACGTGRFTRAIAERVAFVWGVDVSEGMLRRARRSARRDGRENVAFARMDAGDLRFGDGAFDAAACCWALHLFPDVPGALSEIRRVLDDDGRFAGATLTDEYVLRVPGAEAWVRATLDGRVFERDELRRLLRRAGFSGVRTDRRGAALFFAADA